MLNNIPNRMSKGCEVCKKGLLIGEQPPTQIGVAKGPIFLHYCDVCGSYWLETWREAHVISKQEARSTFPDAFDNTDT